MILIAPIERFSMDAAFSDWRPGQPYLVTRMILFMRGHQVLVSDGDEFGWYADAYYEGDLIPVSGSMWESRACALCGQPPIEMVEGHYADACLGIIPGAQAACCGHGVSDGYINFRDGSHIDLGLLPSLYTAETPS